MPPLLVYNEILPYFITVSFGDTDLAVLAVCRAEVTVPPELQLASNSGDVDKVTEMLLAFNKEQPDHGMSKSLQKKLIKDAQIAQKKLSKAGGEWASNPKNAGAYDRAVAASEPAGRILPPPPPPAPTGSREGIAGSSECELVAEFIAALEAFGLTQEAMETVRAHQGALAIAISPTVNAMRNDAYTAGFGAR